MNRLAVTPLEDRLAPAAGDLDVGFRGTGLAADLAGPDFYPSDVALAADGGVVLVGTRNVTNVNGGLTSESLVVRLRPDGQPDTAFDGDGVRLLATNGFYERAGHVAVQADGTVLAVLVTSLPDATTARVYRVSADGKEATQAAFGGVAGIAVNAVTGDVYLADTANIGFVPRDTPPPDVVLTRYDSKLTQLGTVTLDLSGGADRAQGIALDAAGRVYVVASSPNESVGVVRINGNLDLASVVKTTTAVAGSLATGVAVGPTGQVFATAEAFAGGPRATTVLRFNPALQEQARGTAELTTRFGSRSVAVDTVGRVILAGSTSRGEADAADFAVVRLNPTTLAPDATFGTNGRVVIDVAADDLATAVVTDVANRIVVVGPAASNTSPRSATGAAFRLQGGGNGRIELLVGGTVDGRVQGFSRVNGQYVPDTPVATFGGDAVSVRGVTADVTGDGTPDLIGGTGPSVAARVTVIDGASRQLVAAVTPFEAAFTGGVLVAAGDVDGDGFADLIVTPDRGGGPVVVVYSGATLTAGGGNIAELVRFFGIEDPAFRGGARAAAGDLDGDGKADVVVSAGFLGGPRVAVFDGVAVAAKSATPRKLVGDFFAFESTLRNGAFVSLGDVTGDGRADLAFGGGPGGGPRVRLFDGAKLLAAAKFETLDAVGPAQLSNFFAGGDAPRGGVRLALRDADGDGKADLIAGSGDGEPSRVRVYRAATLLASPTPAADQEFDPFGAAVPGGVFVG